MLWWLSIIPVIGAGITMASPQRRLALGLVACSTLLLTLVSALVAIIQNWSATFFWNDTLVLTAALPAFSAVLAVLVPFVSLAVLSYAAAHEAETGLHRLLGLLLVFVGGMELVVIAADFLTLLIGWEIVGACSWALIGHDWRDEENPRAGLYAFVTTRFGDLGLFVAAMAAFAATGSFAFNALPAAGSPWLGIIAAGVLVSAAAKSGQLPFSPWLFRAMAGPTSVSALLHAAAMVAAGAYLLIRLASPLGAAPGFPEAAMAVGLLTALAGGLVGLLQNHAKKLLAASTSAHYGLMFAAVGAGYPGVALLHLTAHAGFKALLFLSAGIAGERAGSFALHKMGYGRILPVVAILTAFGTFALAGVPPLGGAWTKEAVTSAAGNLSPWALAGAVIAGGLSAVYAVRFQLLAYGGGKTGADERKPRIGEYAGLSLLAFLTLALSLLWLPSVREPFSSLIGVRLPESTTFDTVLSLALVATGLLLGAVLVKRVPALGSEGPLCKASDWLGVPVLVSTIVIRPTETLASLAAHADDHMLDGGIRATAAFSEWLSRLASQADDRMIDGGIRATAAFTEWLSRVGNRVGERGADAIPEGTIQLVGLAGGNVRRLQTGFSHHYYALMAAGMAATVIILLLGP